jgi:hypothetical protein
MVFCWNDNKDILRTIQEKPNHLHMIVSTFFAWNWLGWVVHMDKVSGLILWITPQS